ncbi:uncharacterized protein ACA1_392940 [Acanthamoeba castellanii str. Neff]|uniref:Nudix hydrolase domain-containing protein n=1 Tax=Acanthamoeba castellanii (strain ATCC 30010 / Neff) TaxID=1257118 RepID=L8H1L7_ACACF|nr:uncharacterized protein ACA1_392940 [Acanthamoeba castellanii str. Neff]ELR18648.1 hypothetical protein ACA1_392940 [Acanthamoeba castellanii str. Neff]
MPVSFGAANSFLLLCCQTNRGSRLRVIYGAKPADDTPLKTVPDHEIMEAKWLTVEELKGKNLRSHEVKSIFNWAQSGTRLFPTSLLESEDSGTVNHHKVQVNLVAAVEAVVTDGQGRYLAVKGESGKWNIPSATMTRPRQFKLAAAELISGIVLAMEGVLKVYYFAPNSPSNPNPTGFIKVVFLASVAEKFKDFDWSSHGGAQWLSAQEWAEMTTTGTLENENAARLVALAHSTPREQVAPVGVIAMELEALKVL